MATELMPQTTEHCTVERDGGVVTVTLNRPESKNALSPAMMVGMADAWQLIDEDPSVRCGILRGEGDVFCAGADLKNMFATGGEPDQHQKRFQAEPDLAWRALLKSKLVSKPLIAAVEGYAVAGGTEILQGTDIRVAGESAVFGVTEVARGLFPLGGSSVRLRRQIPYTIAAEILLTGRHVPAEEALRIGLIGRVVPDGQAFATAREIAQLICANAPLAVQAVKRSLIETEGLPEPRAFEVEFPIGMPIFGTQDAREGTKAFAEKRAPNYQGN